MTAVHLVCLVWFNHSIRSENLKNFEIVKLVAALSDVHSLGGWKCLNGSFTIQTNFEESSADLKQFATERHGWMASSGELNFARVFSSRTWNEEQSSGATCFRHLVESGELLLLHCLKQK